MKSKKSAQTAFPLILSCIVLGAMTTFTLLIGLIPDIRMQNILDGERVTGRVIKIVRTNVSINDERQYKLEININYNNMQYSLNTQNSYSENAAKSHLGDNCVVFYKDGKIVGPNYNGKLSVLSIVAIVFIIIDIGCIVFIIYTITKALQKKNCNKYTAASNTKQYKKYTWYYDNPTKNNKPNSDEMLALKKRDKVASENEKNNLDNNINMDKESDSFVTDIKKNRESPSYSFEPAPTASDIKPIIPDKKDNTTAKKAPFDTRPANLSDNSNNVLNEMRAAESSATLDELWAKHSNHMPFSDYIAVKREYENIRRNLK